MINCRIFRMGKNNSNKTMGYDWVEETVVLIVSKKPRVSCVIRQGW